MVGEPRGLEDVYFGASALIGPGEVVVATDGDRGITWVSTSVVDAFGWSPEEFAQVCHDLIHPDDALIKEAMSNRVRAEPGVRHHGVARHRARNGHWLWLEVIAVNLLETHGVVLTRFRDVTGTKQAERALADLARDELTGLVTRRLVRRALEDRLASGPSLVVAFCDLDGFKAINDASGHDEGDRRLQELGARLRRWQTASGALVGRWGGDEFVALAEVPGGGPAAIGEELAAAFRGHGDAGLDASIGIVVARRGDDPGATISAADAAMYEQKRAKAAGRPPST